MYCTESPANMTTQDLPTAQNSENENSKPQEEDMEEQKTIKFEKKSNGHRRGEKWLESIYVNADLNEYFIEIFDKLQKERSHLNCRDSEQIRKDVDRSFINFSLNDEKSSALIPLYKQRLFRLIQSVLVSIPNLNYYQGYHDVASMIITQLDDEFLAFKLLYSLTLIYLRDHMMKGIEPTLDQLDLIPEIIQSIDLELYNLISQIRPIYALSSIITLFTHDISNIEENAKIWDYLFTKGDQRTPLYIYVALLIYYKDDIFMDLNEMSDSTIDGNQEFDPDIVHAVLSNFLRKHLHSNSIDLKQEINSILQLTGNIQGTVPLEGLKSFKRISSYSILKNKSISLEIVSLQTDEYEKKKARDKRKKVIVKKMRQLKLIPHIIHQTPFLIKVTVGVGILSILLHSTFRNTNRFCLNIESTKNFVSLWDNIIDHFR